MFKKKDVTMADIEAILKPMLAIADKLDALATKASNNTAALVEEKDALEKRILEQGRVAHAAASASNKFRSLGNKE